VINELDGVESRDLLDHSSRAPAIKLVNMLLFEAVKRRVSDVHIQPLETHTAVRYRIDGVLYDYLRLPKHLLDEVVSRIKVIGRMDIAEKRLAQDGRTTVTIGEKSIDLRISIIPTSLGERVVIRLLDKSARLYRLPELGMSRVDQERFEHLISQTHGIVLVTGPTGSGKSTTLYAALQYLDCKEKNILTLEDPIEYQLPGISQTQVSNKKGMTFATGLRTVLRQDPDIIMVGEIRDEETARMAVQSSLTGHLVFSTLHTNDAAGAVARLLDLGIEPYLVASSLLGVLAQRLIRILCSACAATASLTIADCRLYQIDEAHAGRTIRKACGCDVCASTGYRDRKGIFELLVVDEAIRNGIAERARSSEIRSMAVNGGMTTLRQDGVRKVLEGVTALEEVARVTCQVDSPVECAVM
jgi:general secretion pathway protein E